MAWGLPLRDIENGMGFLTGLLPASPVRKGGVKGSYTKMAIFLTGKPRPGGRGGFTIDDPNNHGTEEKEVIVWTCLV